MKKILINFLFLLLATTCFGQKLKKSISYGVYSKGIYSFKFPRNWSLDDSKKTIILLTEQDGPFDFFRENINLLVKPFYQNKIGIGEYIELSKNQLIKFNVKSLRTDLVYDTNTNMVVGQLSYSMENAGSELLIKQIVKIYNDSIYIFTYTGNHAGFNKYLPIAIRVMNSLVFSDNQYKDFSKKPFEYRNLLHKLYFTHLSGYEDINEDKKTIFFIWLILVMTILETTI